MTIDEFNEVVGGLKPNNFMAINGAGSFLGTADSGMSAVVELQKAAAVFSRSFRSSDVEAVRRERKNLTGKIMVATALDAITQETADQLLEALHQLMKERK